MENYFLDKFKSKSKHELELIVANRANYQLEAVRAAIELLKNNHELELPIPQKSKVAKEQYEKLELPFPQKSEVAKERSKDSNFGVLSLSFNYKPFFRTLSHRDFLTTIAIALFYQAFFEIIDYYSNERFFESTHKAWKGYGFLIIYLANHVIYRFEHRRSNNFIGRSINDLFLTIISIAIRISYEFILKGNYYLSPDNKGVGLFFLLFSIVIFICAFEVVVAIIKFLLKQIRCQIF